MTVRIRSVGVGIDVGELGVAGNDGDDADGDGDSADFLVWQQQFIGPNVVTAAGAIPEPGAMTLTAFAALLVTASGRRRLATS